MITIICGEDTVTSRNYLNSIIQAQKEKGIVAEFIDKDRLLNLSKNSDEALSLFGETKVYVLEKANKMIMRKGSGEVYKALEALSKRADIDLIIWENIGLREVKTATLGTAKEFKPSQTVFQLLDACYPSNLQLFHNLITKLAGPSTDIFIYVLLTRHLRNIVYAKLNSLPSYIQSWQAAKLKKQASLWKQDSLLEFYKKILDLEVELKSGKSIYSLSQSIDIIACSYL